MIFRGTSKYTFIALRGTPSDIGGCQLHMEMNIDSRSRSFFNGDR